MNWPKDKVVTSIEVSSGDRFNGFTLEYFTQDGWRRRINQSWESLDKDIELNNTSIKQL